MDLYNVPICILKVHKDIKQKRLIALFEEQIEIYEQRIHAVYYQRKEHLPNVSVYLLFLAQKLSKYR